MQLDLKHEDLVCLVKGREPKGMDQAMGMQRDELGAYNDNRGWRWNDCLLESLTESELWKLYNLCKDGW